MMSLSCSRPYHLLAVTSPNMTAVAKCFSDDDCDTNIPCSYATPDFWCQCASTNGSETCTRMGKCVQQATCGNCAACVAAVGSFVKTQQQYTGSLAADTVAANWNRDGKAIVDSLNVVGVDSLELVAAAVNAIKASHEGMLGKRAGGLCAQLQCKLLQILATRQQPA
jgi:hypothetical protein